MAVADDGELDDLIQRLRKDTTVRPLGQTSDSLLKAVAGFVALGVPTRRPAPTPEEQRKQVLGCWIALLVWGGATGLGVLGGYLYHGTSSPDRTLHLVVGGAFGVVAVMVVGLLVAIAVGASSLLRRGR